MFVFISSLEKKTKQAAANPGELVFEASLNLLQISSNIFWNEKDILFIKISINQLRLLSCLALALICCRKCDYFTFCWFSCCSGVLRCWSQRVKESDHPVAADPGRPRRLVRKGVQLHWNPAELLQGGRLSAAGALKCRNDPHATSFTTTWSFSQTDLIRVRWRCRLLFIFLPFAGVKEQIAFWTVYFLIEKSIYIVVCIIKMSCFKSHKLPT